MVEAMAQALLEKEVLNSDELERLLGKRPFRSQVRRSLLVGSAARSEPTLVTFTQLGACVCVWWWWWWWWCVCGGGGGG